MSDPNPTPAQQEFNDLVARSARDDSRGHPEDRRRGSDSEDELDEEDCHRAAQIDAAMRMPTLDRGGSSGGAGLKLPPASFDSGRATGVKGVIADARSYEAARRNKWKTCRNNNSSSNGNNNITYKNGSRSASDTDEELVALADGNDDDYDDGDDNDDGFLEQWREARRKELESEAARPPRGRRTSPSVRAYGRLDAVDALGYLDAVEKVRRETKVVVFVTDPECVVSATVEAALLPLVRQHPTVRFVKVACDDIEFDNAAVPAFLAYRDQGELFANLTGVLEMMPDEEDFDSDSLRVLFGKHGIL